MLYDIQSNKWYKNFADLPHSRTEYTYYSDGKQIKLEQVHDSLLYPTDKHFILHRKAKELPDDTSCNKILAMIPKEQAELFLRDRGSLFSEYSSFKYLNVGENKQQQLNEEERYRLLEKFKQQGEVIGLNEEELEYVCQNWKKVIFSMTHS